MVNNEKKQGWEETILKERIELQKEVKLSAISEEMRRKIEERIYQIEEEISNEISEEYVKEILDTLIKFGGDDQNLSGGRKMLWKLLKRKYPKQ